MFDYVDTYIAGVKRVDAVIAALSPTTLTYLDETGTDMDGVLGPGAPPDNNPRYWVAAAGSFAYMFARAANESSTVAQVGASQLMDAPGQEPSVTLLDWSSGLGTARFWVVKLLLESIAPGDALVATAVAVATPGADADALFAVGVAVAGGGARRILLINKRNAWADVALAGARCASVKTIDEATRLGPARDDDCAALRLAPYAVSVVTLA